MTKTRTLLAILISTIIIFLIVNLFSFKQDVSRQFSASEIRQIKVGMSLEDVQEILGQPYKIKSLSGIHNFTCKQQKPTLVKEVTDNLDIRQVVNNKFLETDFCCEGNRRDMQNKKLTLVYTKEKQIAIHYPMLWVHLDDNFKVKQVFAKQYDGLLGFDDPCIYSLSTDTLFENKKLFEKNFKKIKRNL